MFKTSAEPVAVLFLVGRLNRPPDGQVNATAKNEELSMLVHVSWNGATEVARWKLWHSDSEGRYLELLACTDRGA